MRDSMGIRTSPAILLGYSTLPKADCLAEGVDSKAAIAMAPAPRIECWKTERCFLSPGSFERKT